MTMTPITSRLLQSVLWLNGFFFPISVSAVLFDVTPSEQGWCCDTRSVALAISVKFFGLLFRSDHVS